MARGDGLAAHVREPRQYRYGWLPLSYHRGGGRNARALCCPGVEPLLQNNTNEARQWPALE